jgi:CRISPR-associated protein Cas1
MGALYVVEPGACVEREGQHLIVTRQGEVLNRVPVDMVDEVVLIGWTHATTPAILALLKKGIGLTLVSPSGKLCGRLTPAGNTRPMLHYRQYQRGDDDHFCLELGRKFVFGKVYNARTFMRRILRKDEDTNNEDEWRFLTDEIEAIIDQVKACPNLAALRGFEGVAVKKYFQLFKYDLEQHGFGFQKRQRRPPKDPVNSLLSLGYSLLTNTMISACEIAGLDAYAGFFHSEEYNRPALALDLIEEFRVPIVDTLVLRCFNRSIIEISDFYTGENGGLYLKNHALRTFLQQYVNRISTVVHHPELNRAVRYQKYFELQARELRKSIETNDTSHYTPFLYH